MQRDGIIDAVIPEVGSSVQVIRLRGHRASLDNTRAEFSWRKSNITRYRCGIRLLFKLLCCVDYYADCFRNGMRVLRMFP